MQQEMQLYYNTICMAVIRTTTYYHQMLQRRGTPLTSALTRVYYYEYSIGGPPRAK